MARFNVGDRVTYRDVTEEVVALAEPDAVGDIITVDETGEYMFRREDECALLPPPDPRDAVVAAAVAWLEAHEHRPKSLHTGRPYDAAQAWKAAQ